MPRTYFLSVASLWLQERNIFFFHMLYISHAMVLLPKFLTEVLSAPLNDRCGTYVMPHTCYQILFNILLLLLK